MNMISKYEYDIRIWMLLKYESSQTLYDIKFYKWAITWTWRSFYRETESSERYVNIDIYYHAFKWKIKSIDHQFLKPESIKYLND